jgi:hypothetical protein
MWGREEMLNHLQLNSAAAAPFGQIPNVRALNDCKVLNNGDVMKIFETYGAGAVGVIKQLVPVLAEIDNRAIAKKYRDGKTKGTLYERRRSSHRRLDAFNAEGFVQGYHVQLRAPGVDARPCPGAPSLSIVYCLLWQPGRNGG